MRTRFVRLPLEGAELTKDLLCVRISLAHLRFHVRVVADPAAVIKRSRTDYIPLVIVAQLTGNVDRVIDLHGLGIAVLLLPGHSESFHIFEKCHRKTPFSRSWPFATQRNFVRRHAAEAYPSGAIACYAPLLGDLFAPAQGQQRPDVVDENKRNCDPEHHADPVFPSLRTGLLPQSCWQRREGHCAVQRRSLSVGTALSGATAPSAPDHTIAQR